MCPNNLPAQLTSFVGREREREQVRAMLTSRRLTVLTGAGGSGKTRLALQVAADVMPEFPDGAWWVDLTLSDGDGLVESVLAEALGVRPLPGRTPIQAVVDRLAKDRALVVLDNCEHVRDAAADLSEALLRGCPHVVVLATSREPLGVPGESDWRVPPLSIPAAGGSEIPDVVIESDAVRLFVARAVQVEPQFALNDGNARAVARICRELDGIPLAIELASAWVRMLSVEQIAEGVSDRFRLLTGGPRGATARQRTLRGSIDWSFELLSPDERLLLQRLSVFAGGWSLPGVESVCGTGSLDRDAILVLLTSLVDKSLVVVEHPGQLARFRLLETVRQYALELLIGSGELAALRWRHLEFFLALAERAALDLNTPRVGSWIGVLERESANFTSAIDYAIEAYPEHALRTASALTAWWTVGGKYAVGRRALDRALQAADPSPSPLRSRALWSCGYLARYSNDQSTTVRLMEESLAMAESVGDESTTARALSTLGGLRMFRDPSGSRHYLTRGLTLARSAGDGWAEMKTITALGWSYVITAEFAEAERVLADAAPLIETTGAEGLAWISLGLAWCALARADDARCRELAEHTVLAARELGDPATEALAQVMMTRVDAMAGRPQAAQERAVACVERVVARGAGMALPIARAELARSLAALGKLREAQEMLEAVAAGGSDFGWFLCQALVSLADVLRVSGDSAGASVRARQALELSERVGAPLVAADSLEVLGRLAGGCGRWREGCRLLQDALETRLVHDGRRWLAQNLDALAQAAAGLDSHIEAARLLGVAGRARGDLGLVRWLPDADAFAELDSTLADRLGADAYAAARAEGAAMPLDEAISWVRRGRGRRDRPTSGWESLTPTEQQVVKLVAQGFTNPQVAERMLMSRSSVKVHLGHIFKKLKLNSRSELAAQSASRGG